MKDMRNDNVYWRSLGQLNGDPQFQKYVDAEFPEAAQVTGDGLSRRKFLSVMSASLALAGLANCRRPVEKIVPYVVAPEEAVPGIPVDYRTVMTRDVGALGLTVRSFDGRPIKIEGNPAHPSSSGATDAFAQAEILNLYDPERATGCRRHNQVAAWEEFLAEWQGMRNQFSLDGGKGLAVISRSESSPTFKRLYRAFQKAFPNSRWVVYEPVSDELIFKGIKAATGKTLLPVCHIDRAKVIVALDADFLGLESESVRYVGQFADGRRLESPGDEMNRLYVIEGALTLTGSNADHRLRLPSSRIAAFAQALALKLGELGLTVIGAEAIDAARVTGLDEKWLNAVARDLIAHAGESLLLAGRGQSIAVHALVAAINQALGNLGKTIEYREVDGELLPDAQELAKLKYDIDRQNIQALIILGGNPAYDASVPIDVSNIAFSVHISPTLDETSLGTTWHIPQAHFIETWGDACSIDGTLSIAQPLIRPLFDGKSAVELLHALITGTDVAAYDLVRETWRDILPKANWEEAWRRTLHDGIFKVEPNLTAPSVLSEGVRTALAYYPVTDKPPSAEELELIFKPSSHAYDGRYAGNAWLLENPDPITKLTWDNAALMSPKTAQALGLSNHDVVRVTVNEKYTLLPVWITPGQADYTIVVDFGFGRRNGAVAAGVGANVYALRSTVNSFIERSVKVEKTGKRHELASTQDHGSMQGRPIIREATLEHYRRHPNFAHEMVEHPPLQSLWREHQYDQGYQWGMIIDLTTCIGCGACTVACQSENNIPVVGKLQVGKGREMHWMRIDRYFTGTEEDPQVVHQPMACQHCEMAPCEGVCPVSATVHDREGLNVMVYNRCVGTRYCSNNCPFKVRRFNFFNYNKKPKEIEKLHKNPNVTVRARGVMEKCTYCLQRINEAKEKAKQEGRALRDGDVLTACQQVCPTRSITFGNILDSTSAVVRRKQQARSYGVLSELNLKARTTYLAKVRNPNPELA